MRNIKADRVNSTTLDKHAYTGSVLIRISLVFSFSGSFCLASLFGSVLWLPSILFV